MSEKCEHGLELRFGPCAECYGETLSGPYRVERAEDGQWCVFDGSQTSVALAEVDGEPSESVAKKIADALNARAQAEPEVVAADVIGRAAGDHDCPEGHDGETPEPTIVWTMRCEAIAVEDDGGDPWEHGGRYWGYEAPVPTTALMFPCGQIVPLDGLYAAPGQKGPDLKEAEAEREELRLSRGLARTRIEFDKAIRAKRLDGHRVGAAGHAFQEADRAWVAFYAARPKLVKQGKADA